MYYIIKNENKFDDIVQEVFVKIWKKSNSFKSKSNIKTWIYRITINSAYDFLRKEKKHITTDEKSIIEPEDIKSKNKLENEQLIKNALNLLTDKQRGPFVLHYIQGLTTLEVAAALSSRRNCKIKASHFQRNCYKLPRKTRSCHMTNDDKNLKAFMKKNTKAELKKTINEFSEILAKVEQRPASIFQIPKWYMLQRQFLVYQFLQFTFHLPLQLLAKMRNL